MRPSNVPWALRISAAIWGLGGVVAVLGFAVIRLAPIALEGLAHPLDWRHWTLLVVNTAFMAYSEGYRGFQQGYAPRVVARAVTLSESPTVLRGVLAPLFCMGYFHTTRRRLISAYALTIGIIALIAFFQYIRQPWRGLLDVGVVVGLSWGITSLIAFAFKAWLGPGLSQSPELPEPNLAAPGG